MTSKKTSDVGRVVTTPVVMLSLTKDMDGKTNYSEWVERVQGTLGTSSGDLGRLFGDDKEYVPPPVTAADYTPVVGPNEPPLTAAQLSELRLDALKNRNKKLRELQAGHADLYNAIWATIDTGSQLAAQAHPLFAEGCRVKRNPNVLWRILKETHFTNVDGAQGNEQLRLQVRNRLRREYALLVQKPGVAIAAFKKKHDELLLRLEAVGVARPSEQELAISFIDKLYPNRHGAMQAHMANNAGAAEGGYPATLQAAYTKASEWRSAVRARTVDGTLSDAVFLTADEAEPAVLLADNAAPPKPARPVQSKKKSGGATPAAGAAGTTAAVPARKPYVERRICHRCKVQGHIERNCPVPADAQVMLAEPDGEEDDEELAYTSTFMVEGELEQVLFSNTEVVFDSAAGQSVFNNGDLVHARRAVPVPRRIGGVNADGGALEVVEEGVFADLGMVGLCPAAAANLLSQTQLKDRGYQVAYDGEQDLYRVRGSKREWVFDRKVSADGTVSRFYTLDMAMIATVAENERRYTVRQLKQADKADVMLQRLGYMSPKVAIQLINKGVLNSDVTATDMRTSIDVRGPSAAALRGKTKKRTPTAITGLSLSPRVTQVQQALQVDVFYVKGLAFLIGVMSPLGLVQTIVLQDRTAESIAAGLQCFLDTAASRSFDIRSIHCDGEGAVGALRDDLGRLGLVVLIAGPGQHVPVVERMIQTVKERVRVHEHALPYVMTKMLIVHCVQFCVRSINLQPSSTATDTVSPHEQFTGIKLDAKRDLRVAFGDFVHATVPVTDNTMAARTQGCVALCPTGNLTGSVRMWCLATNAIVVRDQFIVLPMPDHVIAHITNKAKKQGLSRGADPSRAELVVPPNDDDVEVGHAADENHDGVPLPDMMPIDGRQDAPVRADLRLVPAGAGVVVGAADGDHAAEGGDEATRAEMSTTGGDAVEATASAGGEPADDVSRGGTDGTAADNSGASGFGQRWSTRLQERHRTAVLTAYDVMHSTTSSIAARAELARQLQLRAHWHDRDFAFHISVRAAMRERGAEAAPVIMAELQQMVDKKVWHPIHVRGLSHEQRKAIIRSTMFLKDKYLASGVFEKFKARLVAGGDQQNKGLYENLSSPTAATGCVLTVAALAAREGRSAAVMDIGGAFLNADISPTGVKVHMRLDRIMTTMLLKLREDYQPFVEPNGTLVVELDKALYGCVEAAALWYRHLRLTLLNGGFRENAVDPCVFNKQGKSGDQVTIALHVDDLLVTCKQASEIEEFYSYLKSVYPETKITRGKVLDYLGMTFDFKRAGEVKVTMANCVQEILREAGAAKPRATPATERLFDVRDSATKATKAEAERFHSQVARLLYLAKRVRPDCLTAVAFLTTRIHACDSDDLGKLQRVLGYLGATQECGIVLRVGETVTVRAFIDAAYNVHQSSGRSHTGCSVVVGEAGPVHCRSAKQKIVTKSSTEAELVALSDTASQAIHLRNFLIAQGYDVPAAVLYQDNLSCMALVRRGSRDTSHCGTSGSQSA